MQLSVAYSQAEERATMRIKYDGEMFDPEDSDNILSLRLVKNAAESIGYEHVPADELANVVTVTIK